MQKILKYFLIIALVGLGCAQTRPGYFRAPNGEWQPDISSCAKYEFPPRARQYVEAALISVEIKADADGTVTSVVPKTLDFEEKVPLDIQRMLTPDFEQAAIAGWSDGAIISLIAAMRYPDRVERAFAYAGNMDLSGARSEPLKTRAMDQSFARAMDDYARLSETPDQFQAMLAVMDRLMHAQPNYRAEDLSRIPRPVAIVQGEFDEFIRPEHAAYLAKTIPDARLITLPGVSHFAPWQDAEIFNNELLGFLQQ